MSNYTKTTDFEAKDSLTPGDPNKVIKGSEFETEFDNISTAIATKADTASPTFTGAPVLPSGTTVNGVALSALELNVTVQTGAFNALVGSVYMVDTSLSAFTATLPASPSIGDKIGFMDVESNFDTNNLTLGRNSLKVFNDAADGTIDEKGYAGVIVYTGTTYGWMPMF